MSDLPSRIIVWKEDAPSILRCHVEIWQSDLLELSHIDRMKCQGFLTGANDKTPSEVLFELASIFKILEDNSEVGG